MLNGSLSVLSAISYSGTLFHIRYSRQNSETVYIIRCPQRSTIDKCLLVQEKFYPTESTYRSSNMVSDFPSIQWSALASTFPFADERIRQILLDPNASATINLPTVTPEWSSLTIRRLGFGGSGRVLQVSGPYHKIGLKG
jgi:hypothetical protein